MDNLKIYQICHHLIDYFATLTSPKKSYLGPIFRTGVSIQKEPQFALINESKLLWVYDLSLQFNFAFFS